MNDNSGMAREARAMLNDVLGLRPIAPESMVGALGSVRLPRVLDEDG